MELDALVVGATGLGGVHVDGPVRPRSDGRRRPWISKVSLVNASGGEYLDEIGLYDESGEW
jgi:hypothetical protein